MSQVTSQNALVKDSTVQTLNGKLDNLNATLGGNANIAPVFNTATAYSKGDMVNYNGDLYVFTANHSAGAWTGSDVVQTKVSSELSSLKSGLMSRAVILGGGEISSNSSATVQLLSSHLYLVTLGHPYSEAGMAIVASYTSGSNKVTWIKTRTGVTISEDSSLVLTIAAEASVWYTVVDMGAI